VEVVLHQHHRVTVITEQLVLPQVEDLSYRLTAEVVELKLQVATKPRQAEVEGELVELGKGHNLLLVQMTVEFPIWQALPKVTPLEGEVEEGQQTPMVLTLNMEEEVVGEIK
jgi:hypothetical protein